MKPTVFIFSFLLLCFENVVQAQGISKKDSLLSELKITKNDTNKVKLYYNIAKFFEPTDLEAARNYYKAGKELSEKIAYNKGVFNYYANVGDIFMNQGKFDSALVFSLESVAFAKGINDSLNLSKTLMNVGIAYYNLSETGKAFEYIEQSRDISFRLGDISHEGKTYNLLQLLAREVHQYRRGVNYGRQSVAKLEQVDVEHDLGYAYNNLGLNYIELKMYDSAKYFLKKSLAAPFSKNDVLISIVNNLNLGYIELLQGNFAAMKPYADVSLQLARQQGMKEFEGLALWGLSQYYLSKRDYANAKRYADSSLTIAELNNSKSLKIKVFPTLSSIAYAMQDEAKGFYYFNQYQSLNDSIVNETVTHASVEMEQKFETAQKEAQIKLQHSQLKQKTILNYLLIGGAIALFMIGLLYYRNYNNKQKLQQAKIEELEKDKQLTATEAVLKGEEQERTRLAKDLHDGLGGMLSGIKFSLNTMKGNLIMTPENAQAFERSIDMLDSSINEMRRVAHNMMPEVLVKYGLDVALKEFCGEIDRSGVIHVNYQSIGMNNASLEQIAAVTIYRVVQELVNNSIKHAKAENVLVQAHASTQDKLLAVTVEDDGIGFNITELTKSSGIGWSNIQNRIEFLKGKIDVNSGRDNGTSIMIEIGI